MVYRMVILLLAICLMPAFVRADLSQKDPQTAKLFDRFFNGMTFWNGNTTNPKFVALLHARDADLFFLKWLENKSSAVAECAECGVLILKTDHSFTLLCNRLKRADAKLLRVLSKAAKLKYDSDRFDLTWPVAKEIDVTAQVIAGFNQPRCVTPLLTALKADLGDPSSAGPLAKDLESFHDPRINPVLVNMMLHYPKLRAQAISELLARNSRHGARQAYLYFKNPPKADWADWREWIVLGLGENHHKAAVDTMVDILPMAEKLHGFAGDPVGTYAREIRYYLSRYMMTTNPWMNCLSYGGYQYHARPAEYYSSTAIRKWWKKYRSAFNNDMHLRAGQTGLQFPPFAWHYDHLVLAPAKMPTHPLHTFSRDARNISLSVGLNGQRYRVGDPIRMDVTFANKSSHPITTRR